MAEEKPTFIPPLIAGTAVAAVGLLALLLFDHGVWNNSPVQSETMVQSATTTRTAQAAGATVTATPKSIPLQPIASGPKPAQPATPDPAK